MVFFRGTFLLVVLLFSDRVSFALCLLRESVISPFRFFEYDSRIHHRRCRRTEAMHSFFESNQIRQKCSRRSSSLAASVLDLFRVLEKEEEEAANNNKNQKGIDANEKSRFESLQIDEYDEDDDDESDDNYEDDIITSISEEGDDDDDDDNLNDDGHGDGHGDDEYVVSDAEALLACWSFLKRRKRLGKWIEYEERQAQKALSRNYFLTDDEVGDELLDEILLDDDDDEDEDTNTEQESRGEEEDDEVDLTYNDHYDDDDDDHVTSMATVQDLLFDDYKVDGDIDSSGDVAKDIKIISSLIADQENPMAMNANGIEIEMSTKVGDIDLSYSEFTSFPTEPSDTRLRRVNAMKRRWEDHSYRERWYQKRWGNRKRKKELQSDIERNAIQRARALPHGFLGSDELVSMTEEEIADAIRARIESTRKRVAKRKQTLRGRKEFLATQMKALEVKSAGDEDISDPKEEDSKLQNLSRDSLFAPDKKKLEQAKRERSERAKRLYATRLKNQESQNGNETNTELQLTKSQSLSKMKSSPRKKGPYYPPKQQTPQDAFLRIENDLDRGVTPSVDDVRLILVPGKMKNRKPLLKRILLDEFNLRGKCVPPTTNLDGDDVYDDPNDRDEIELEFAHRCTIERLGLFIIHLLKRDRS